MGLPGENSLSPIAMVVCGKRGPQMKGNDPMGPYTHFPRVTMIMEGSG